MVSVRASGGLRFSGHWSKVFSRLQNSMCFATQLKVRTKGIQSHCGAFSWALKISQNAKILERKFKFPEKKFKKHRFSVFCMKKLLNKLMSFDICVSLLCGNEITNFFLHNSHFSLNFTSKRRRAKKNEKEIKCKWSMPVCAIFRVFVLCTSLYRHIILNAELGQTAHSLLLHMPFAYGFLFKGPQFWFKCMWFCGTFKQTTTGLEHATHLPWRSLSCQSHTKSSFRL